MNKLLVIGNVIYGRGQTPFEGLFSVLIEIVNRKEII